MNEIIVKNVEEQELKIVNDAAIPEGGYGGAVNSVNGQTGNVILDAEDVGAVGIEQLETIINNTLQQAKESGEFGGVYMGKDKPDGNIFPIWIEPDGKDDVLMAEEVYY